MTVIERLQELWRELPVAHRVMAAAAVVVAGLAAVFFFQWVSTPSYTVLYSGLDDTDIAGVIDELESLGVAYQLDGSTVQVPKGQLFDIRARLAGAGIAGSPTPAGYELLDSEGLTVNDFRQRIDFQRAVEGELSRTLMALDAINTARVQLVIPEDQLFRESSAGATASVLVGPKRTLTVGEVETIIFLVSSAVEDLAPSDVTVADTSGNTLNAPDGMGGATSVISRNLRTERELEAALARDVTQLLAGWGQTRARVSVNAVLNFDETESQVESIGPTTQTPVRQQTIDESYSGTGAPPGGVVGVDGGPDSTGDATTTDYSRTEANTEFAMDRTVTRLVSAPGEIEGLSVAVVLDDGSLSGIAAPNPTVIGNQVAAALGLNEDRGDVVDVQAVAMEAIDEEAAAAAAAGTSSIMDLIPQVLGGLALLVVAAALFLMSRGRTDTDQITWLPAPPAGFGGGSVAQIGSGQQAVQAALTQGTAGIPVAAGFPAAAGLPGARQQAPTGVATLAQRQPEEIATLLRSWLAEGNE